MACCDTCGKPSDNFTEDTEGAFHCAACWATLKTKPGYVAELKGNKMADNEEDDREQHTVDEVLIDTGGTPFGIEPGWKLGALVEQGARMLDKACLHNVAVVRANGKYYLGEFLYIVREVPEEEARTTIEQLAEIVQ